MAASALTPAIAALAMLFPASEARAQDQAIGRLLQGYHRAVPSALLWEIIPNYQGSFRGIPFRTNQWGMHDKEYTLARPRNVYRIALLGSSITVGAGVPQDQTMEQLLEDKLNREWPGTPARKFEILNFSAGQYGILQNVLVTEQKLFAFNPNAVFVGVFSVEVGRMRSYLVKVVKSGYRFQDPFVNNKLKQAGVEPSMQEPELQRRLGPASQELVKWSYARILEICRQKNIPVIGLVLPEPQVRFGRNIDTSASLAAEAGLPLVDLRGVYAGMNTDSLVLGDRDPHWSVAGNKLISEKAFQLLKLHDRELLKLGDGRAH